MSFQVSGFSPTVRMNVEPYYAPFNERSIWLRLLGVKETRFISWGLQQTGVDEKTPRSIRLNVDSHF